MPQSVTSHTPSGTIISFGGTTNPPGGWMICDGSSILRTTYSRLFDAIGTAFGAADGSHFNIPDLRGRFIRGLDAGAGVDPDAGSRIAMLPGGNTADNVGSLQADQYAQHSHDNTLYSAGGGGPSINGFAQGPFFGTQATNASGGNETRPKNVYTNYIIKL